MAYVRFDDRLSGRVRSFSHPFRVIVAERTSEVVPALQAVSEAVAGGAWAAGYVAYEAAPAFDRALVVGAPPVGLPLAWFGLFREPDPRPPELAGAFELGDWKASISAARHADAVERIQHHIRLGDTYQVNFSYRLAADFQGSTRGLYRRLLAAQPTALGAYLETDAWQVASASPELFFELDGDLISTRPMKGTAGRGRWSEEDETRGAELARSVKDRAENLMIVDLVRNDLGRIARFGTVAVPALFQVERYPTVWQMTSTVTGRLRHGIDLTGVFAALFPCGSVTGAPKVRTMQLIADLESEPRGIYTGAIGWAAPPTGGSPSARFNVAIRTVTVESTRGQAEYGVGGGIVFDSRPQSEWEEAETKALILDAPPTPGLLETMRWEPEVGLCRIAAHLDRLAASARYLGIPFDRGRAERLLAALVPPRPAPARVRLLLDPDGGLCPTVEPLSESPVPIRVGLDREPVDPSDPLLFHKAADRSRYRIRRERHPEVDDVLMVNRREEVTESTVANVAVRVGESWLTPPLDSGCLPGIYRGELVAAGRLREAPIPVETLPEVDEMALVSSLRRWRPAVLCDLP